MTKTKLWVIGALVRQRLVLPFCPPLLSLLVLVSCLAGNFENENVRKTGLLNAFLLLSSSFLSFCEWFVPVLLVFYWSSVLLLVCFCSFVICGCRSYEGTLPSLSSASTCPCLPLSFLLFVFPQYFPPFSVALLISLFFLLFWVSSSLSFPPFFFSLSPFLVPSVLPFSSLFVRLLCFFEKKPGEPKSALSFFFLVPLPLWFLSLRSLIFSGFIAREYQPFETASKPLLPETAPEEEGEEGDEQLLKTVPFVRWEWPFSIWSLKFCNRAIKPLCKL